MENEECDPNFNVDKFSVEPSSSAVNNLILDYYKKFGRKRDLEQFFSLSTAQSDIRDPSGTFWRKMKSQHDSSDSSEKKSESPTELCRISIKCSVPEPSSIWDKNSRDNKKSDSESPPIITEEQALEKAQDSDVESVKSDDVQSQRSNDATLDTSMNKPHSPTSSITSQRKLEWDSLADVGYANESDRKTSASSLSTLERLALKQQYSHNDTRENIELGPPTSQSTPLEEIDTKSKGKKSVVKKTTKIYQKDVDLVELNVPHCSQTNLPQAISVNLSKHISFNVERDGEINIDNIKRNISVSPEKNVEIEKQIQEKIDKEIQTSLIRNKDKSTSLTDAPKVVQKFPVLMNLNTLRKRNRKKKLKMARRKLRNRHKEKDDENNLIQEKTTEQVSEAESFEYMPGHMYNQNHIKINQSRGTNAGNKSSLESSAGLTTDSSKGSKHSFSKDLEKSIELLKTVLQQNNDDSTLKKKLIKEVVQRLIKSKYKDDESSTDFLSGLSFNSKILGLSEGNKTTTSTSEGDNNDGKTKLSRPRKSILRKEKFNSDATAAISQSAPNLPSISNIEKPETSDQLFFSNTGSDTSYKENMSSDKEVNRTTSEELYKKYLEALRREQAHRRQLKVKETFFKQKLGGSDSAISQLVKANSNTQSKLKSLINDLTRNNYDDGSGDASKLEGHSNTYLNMDLYPFVNKPRSHSVFTLSSGSSQNKNKPSKKTKDISKCLKGENSVREHHYCCCPYHTDHAKVGVVDSSVQVNINNDNPIEFKTDQDVLTKQVICMRCKNESPRTTKVGCDTESPDLRYVCMCSEEGKALHKVPEKFLIYKCSKLVDKSVQLGDSLARNLNIDNEQCKTNLHDCNCKQRSSPRATKHICNCNDMNVKQDSTSCEPTNQNSKSSQTNVNLNLMLRRNSSVKSLGSQSTDCTNCTQKNFNKKPKGTQSTGESVTGSEINNPKAFVHEIVRSIQTEISIDPKISDPSLSDIKVIDDTECVKMIKEQYKDVFKSSTGSNTIDNLSEKDYRWSSGTDSCVKFNSDLPTKKETQDKSVYINYATLKQNKGVQSEPESLNNIQNTNFIDQFTIPIQGTNMTLKVNLGTNDSDTMKDKDNILRSKGIVTDRIDVVEHFTSLRDDCTKSVQCTEQDTSQKTNQMTVEDVKRDINFNKPKDTSTKAHCCTVNTCSVNEPKFNTYPKEDHTKAIKPLTRSNTDTNNFKNVDFSQIDLKKCKKTANQLEPQNDCKKVTERSKSNENLLQKCYTSSSEQPSKKITDKPKPKENLLQKCYTNSSEKSSNKVYDQPKAKENLPQKSCTSSSEKSKEVIDQSEGSDNLLQKCCTSISENSKANDETSKTEDELRTQSKALTSESESQSDGDTNRDPILQLIKDITKRYTKKDVEKSKKKKCFKEIMSVLNYLLDTEDSTDEHNKESKNKDNSVSNKKFDENTERTQKECTESAPCTSKTCVVDKGIQLSPRKSKTKTNRCKNTESSEIGVSTEFPTTSSDSATCKVLNKIKKECEKYHQKRCKSHNGLKACETSSTTSVNCDQCRRIHHCHCVRHKCRGHKTKAAEKPKKKCVAYNLILQTSDSVVSEDNVVGNACKPLKSIIVKVPSKRKQTENVPFREMAAKFERYIPQYNPCTPNRAPRSKSLPNESDNSSTEEFLRKAQTCTVREYLERNRPDFVEKCSKRQDCLRFINETRQETCPSRYYKMVVVHTPQCSANTCSDPCNMHCGGATLTCNQCVGPYNHLQTEVRRIANERNAKRKLLSLQLDRQQTLSAMTDEELRYFAKQLSEDLRRKNVAPKFINEREMKKHSEKIYKSLPEVTRKKEELKKENMKKTNLLMANIFKKNLQKKTLRGSVNLSNYSTVIKI